MKLKVSKFSVAVCVFVLASICIFIGFIAGNKFAYSYSYNIFSTGENLSKQDMDLFWQAYEKLSTQYIGDIDKEKFVYGAISGAFSSLGDPYTAFLPPDISEEFTKELAGELEGIGIKIGILDNFPTVIAPLKNSPAYKAGIRAKDKIIKVDDFETEGQPIDIVVSKIRGPAGSKVVLEILRNGTPEKIEVVRQKIEVDTVELDIKDGIAKIAINEFGVKTSDEFSLIAQEVIDQGVEKVIIDLRNNPGGILDEAIKVAGYIFGNDVPVVIEEGRNGKKVHKTEGPGTLKNLKLAVLVNEGSASAAEILAGAIQDNGRGDVFGTKTFGKGTVQQLEYLPQGSSVKITVAKWLTPKGHDIDQNGIIPSKEIAEKDNQLFSDSDPVLESAIESLSK
ncbi:MAG: S41 family peptidase [Bacillota bacterium]